HFTNSVDHIKSILKDGFFPHYCPEYSLDPADRREASRGRPPMHAIPIVSFCDLPLSLIGKHLEHYGHFGIGLDKRCGVNNGVARVISTHSRTQTRASLLLLPTEDAKNSGETAARDMMLLAAYTKPFEGPAWRRKKVHKKVRFYDEREWRYVPRIQKGQSLFLGRKDFNNITKKNAFQKRLKEHNVLPVHPDYVQYLIVPYDKEENNISKCMIT